MQGNATRPRGGPRRWTAFGFSLIFGRWRPYSKLKIRAENDNLGLIFLSDVGTNLFFFLSFFFSNAIPRRFQPQKVQSVVRTNSSHLVVVLANRPRCLLRRFSEGANFQPDIFSKQWRLPEFPVTGCAGLMSNFQWRATNNLRFIKMSCKLRNKNRIVSSWLNSPYRHRRLPVTWKALKINRLCSCIQISVPSE